MKICFVLLYYNHAAQISDPLGWLAQYPLMRHLPQAVAKQGHDVQVVVQFPQNFFYRENEVSYHFISAGKIAQISGHLIGQMRHTDPVFYEAALRPLKYIQSLQPDLIHFHGIILNLNLFLLHLMLPQIPIILHYHGGYPAKSNTLLQQFNLRRVKQILFTTADHARPFIQANLIQPQQVSELMEVSTTFKPCPREAARAQTGMHGDPVFLSVGRLHPIKDPLTMLRGFALIQQFWRGAQLYLYYLTAELLPEMQQFVIQHQLQQAVHFRGRAPLADMEMIYNSADFLLQASQREFSGYAVLEAMACGVIPIVTDIPSFRAMTAQGQHGRLFPLGDTVSLARQVLTLTDWRAMSAPLRAHFEQHFSYTALAQQLHSIYQSHAHA